jgi:pyruvate/2-oxoglutarate dehydrogenase complex dihydrolipoamide acyltransferase (E2) component
LARKLAEELGVDLATLTGTGPGGRIVKEDVEAATNALPTSVATPIPAAIGCGWKHPASLRVICTNYKFLTLKARYALTLRAPSNICHAPRHLPLKYQPIDY